MVSEAAVRETVAPDDHATAESPTPKMMVTVAAGPSKEIARISAVAASALVVVSSAQPTSSAAGRASSCLCLEEDVVLQFDATHHLSELTKSWGRLAAGAASFREQLQVVIFFFLVFVFPVCFTLFSYFLPFSAGVVFLSGSL
jgi:hypothetical protein